MNQRNIDLGKIFQYTFTMATLWKRKNDFYYALWQEGGKQRQQSLGTKEERIAKRLFRHFKRELAAGKIKPISRGIRQTFYPFVNEFLEHIETTTSHSTYQLYETALQKAKSVFGDMPLAHITSRHIDKLVKDMIRAGLERPTVNKNYRHVKAALNKAYEWEYLKSPVRFPKPLKEEEKVRYLSKKQLVALISKMSDDEVADCCLFSAYTGLRSGEIIRLKWNDVDNPEGFLRISSKQKNKKESWIPINNNAKAILDRCKARRGLKPFRFQTRQWISKLFKKAARKAELSQFRFHDLRHTYGSHLAMSGENEASIQKLLRHKSMASTIIYTNVSPEYLRQASEKVNYGPMPLPNNKKKNG